MKCYRDNYRILHKVGGVIPVGALQYSRAQKGFKEAMSFEC